MTLTLVVARHSGAGQNPSISGVVSISIVPVLEVDTGYKHAGMTLTLVIAVILAQARIHLSVA